MTGILQRCLLSSIGLLAAAALGACGDDGPGPSGGYEPQPEPPLGATSFISAASPLDGEYRGPDVEAPTDGGQAGGDGDRTIEEGDIYRVLGGGLVLNLNAYRGLQVIDVSDPDAPAIVGTLRTTGSPVELYVDGDRAVVLMNSWYGYWGAPAEDAYGRQQGGAALLVDLSDPTAPALLDRVVVLGDIQRSRLAKGSVTALYVAASLWQLVTADGTPVDPASGSGGGTGEAVAVASTNQTIVQSYEVGAAGFVARDQIDLGGWVSDIHAPASADALLVARMDYTGDNPTSQVALIDISAPDGTMILGPDIAVAGQVKSQFNMDKRGDILRVVSEGLWSATATNHLETFDVSDPAAPVAVDHETFGDEQSLFATLFVGDDKAFFVTYLRQDPFHAFEISATGDATERAEFIVSGWNDFFRAVFGDTRLVGVGIDDAGGARDLAVSLYDITELTNPEPLLQRATASLDSVWSEASWDHRAFSVLEDAVAVTAGDGTAETGLVLLPYSGWDGTGYRTGVQLFTFSETTVTTRGTLAADAPVRRGFLAAADTAACLSDVALGLYDIADPDTPAALGQVDLAPAYTDLLVYGDYGLRLRDTATWTWWGDGNVPPPARAQVIPLAGDPDTALEVAGFDVPPGASLTQVGDLAVVMQSQWQSDPADPKGGAWETAVAVWSLADPTAPQKTGELVTAALQPNWGYYYGGWGAPEPAMADCFSCPGWWGGATPRGTAVGDAIAFLEGVTESAPGGTREICVTRPPGSSGSGGTDGGTPVEPPDPGVGQPTPGDGDAGDAEDQVWYTGGIECVSVDGGPETCYGAIYQCTGFEADCMVVADPASVGAETECKSDTWTRYWTRYVVHVLDLSDPAAPAVTDPITLPTEEEGAQALAVGDTFWVSTRVPYVLEGDARAYVKYYARPIGLQDPAAPVVGAAVNVPGVLLAVKGSALFTLDFAYNQDVVESAVSRCTLSGSTCALAARNRIAERWVTAVQHDGGEHVLVTHSPATWWYGDAVVGSDDDVTWEVRLSVLDAQTLAAVGEAPLDTWADLRHATPGRALFQVPGGLLVMDLATPAAPRAQAFFATNGWPSGLTVVGDHAWFAAGLYGIYGFDLAVENLLPAP